MRIESKFHGSFNTRLFDFTRKKKKKKNRKRKLYVRTEIDTANRIELKLETDIKIAWSSMGPPKSLNHHWKKKGKRNGKKIKKKYRRIIEIMIIASLGRESLSRIIFRRVEFSERE